MASAFSRCRRRIMVMASLAAPAAAPRSASSSAWTSASAACCRANASRSAAASSPISTRTTAGGASGTGGVLRFSGSLAGDALADAADAAGETEKGAGWPHNGQSEGGGSPTSAMAVAGHGACASAAAGRWRAGGVNFWVSPDLRFWTVVCYF
ncbi:hypothetical protein SORBI_3008G098032 [Sorghum bicolor]|uniref:Uncharacterized protein n=1 Tax=Sorghum bicolor TaxID=4558 RepID=A0A1Z5R5W5_SORBI|nr:hypothetical protein SORBI_3008G098032 [Sorghum bicolor]